MHLNTTLTYIVACILTRPLYALGMASPRAATPASYMPSLAPRHYFDNWLLDRWVSTRHRVAFASLSSIISTGIKLIHPLRWRSRASRSPPLPASQPGTSRVSQNMSPVS
ncbi:hypothetical protein EDB80DRAFT_28545 [Ilyonectria destructans]|nr:hypothetical protein EDB80DRAFT_28545 [Ilyonectria destructans]